MPKNLPIRIDVLHLPAIKAFITSVQEIAGTTNDPDTAANLRAALNKLRGGTSK